MNRLHSTLLALALVFTPACDLLGELEQRGGDEDPGTLLLEVGGTSPLGFVAWTESGKEVLMQQRASDGTGLRSVEVSTGATRRLASPITVGGQRVSAFEMDYSGGVLYMNTGRGAAPNYCYALDRFDLEAQRIDRLRDNVGPLLGLAATPDGTQVYYVDQRGSMNLRRLDAATGTTAGVSTVRARSSDQVYFGPEADQLVYLDDDRQAYHLDLTSSQTRSISFSGRVVDVLWGADGPRVVLTDWRSSGSEDRSRSGMSVSVKAFDGSPAVRLASSLDRVVEENVLVDLERDRLLYWRPAEDGLLVLRQRSLQTGEERTLASQACPSRCSIFSRSAGCGVQMNRLSPDGDWLVYHISYFDDERTYFRGGRLLALRLDGSQAE